MSIMRTYLDIINEANAALDMPSEMNHLMPLPDEVGVEVAYFNLKPRGADDLEIRVTMEPNGTYYAHCYRYEFTAATADAMRQKLRNFGFTGYQYTKHIRSQKFVGAND